MLMGNTHANGNNEVELQLQSSIFITMFLNSIKINRVVTCIFVVACGFHVSHIVSNILNPQFPQVRHYKKVLKDIEFPISFLICIDQIVNDTTKYREVGYSNVYRFYIGESMHNESVIGWRGHMKNGSTYDTVEGFVIS